MPYKIIKPKIPSVSSVAWGPAKYALYIFAIMIMFVLSDIFSPLLLFIPMYLLYQMGKNIELVNKSRNVFWEQVAKVNGWEYKGAGNSDKETGFMFRQGTGWGDTFHNVEGKVDGRAFRIFDYKFSIGKGDNQKTYTYTVFAFKFAGSFPHIYLNNKKNSYNVSIGEHISMPAELEKKFSLSAPRKYEIEAMEIFTPDLLAKLTDSNLDHDIEFVGQEMILFHEWIIDDFDKLEKEFDEAIALVDLFDEKLDKFKFEQIGDMSSRLIE